MMSATSPTLRCAALLLTICILLGCFSGCFGGDHQEETQDPLIGPETTDSTLATDGETEPPVAETEASDPTEESTEPTEESTEPTEETEPEGLAGTIIGDALNVRSGPSTGTKIVGTLVRNDRVLILEQQLVDNKLWGKTEDGWISLNYVLLDDPSQVLTVKETLKGIVLDDKIKAYEGPGSHYAASGTIRKDTRVTVLETCGKWGRTETGWIELEKVYIDGSEGPEPPEKGTVTGSKVNVRSDPSTKSTVQGTVNSGDRVEIFYQVKIGDITWGCTKDGWISMDYVRLDKEARKDIAGSWYCHWSIVETSSAISYYTRTYTFRDDGTYDFASFIIDVHLNSYEIYASGSGYYTFDGSTLVLGNRGYAAELKDGELRLTEASETLTYVPGDLEDAVAHAMSQHKEPEPTETEPAETEPLETEPTEPEPTETEPAETEPTETEPAETEAPAIDPSILGTWQDVTICTSCESGQCLRRNAYWVFRSDGTFTHTECEGHYFYASDTGPVYDTSMATGSQEKRGTYTFDGSTLVLTYTFIEWEDITGPILETKQVTIQGGRMTMVGGYTANLRKGSFEEVAAQLFA